MNGKLLALTFLILSLTVTPVFATPSYVIHSSIPVWVPHHDPYHEGPTIHFGGGVWIWTDWNDLRVTEFFVDSGAYTWFNYTVDYIYAGADQKIYCAYHTVTALYVNDVLYLEDHPSSFCYWYEDLGIVNVLLGSVAKPANVSIAYIIPPPAEMTAVFAGAYDIDTNNTQITAGSITVTNILGNSTTLSLPASFSVIKGQTYTYTISGDLDWSFNSTLLAGETNPFNWIFAGDTGVIACFFNAIPASNLLPVPIIFIFGMVGLACMFIGPVYGINKIKNKEYRQGFVWAVIITALGFALFIAWLFGGSF